MPRGLKIALALPLVGILYASNAWTKQVTLQWEASASHRVAGYRVYYGSRSGRYESSVDVGPRTAYTLTGLREGQTYYFAVRAYDGSGELESDFSNEVAGTVSVAVLGSSSESRTATEGTRASFVAETLVVLPDYATSFVFTGPDRMLVTQKGGFGGSQKASIWVVQNGRLDEEPLITLPDVQTRAQMGLLGVAVDPDYGTNRFVYAFYTHAPSSTSRVVRLRDHGRRVSPSETKVLLEIPADVCGDNPGGSVAFGPDGMLYVGVGDGGCDPCVSQDGRSLAGKILRVTRDGEIPDDNPFAGSPIFAFGFGNPVTLVFQPESGELLTNESTSGARGETNRVLAAHNYGHPTFQCASVVNRACSPSEPLNIPPISCYGDHVALRGLVFYSGGRYLENVKGNLIVGDSRTGTLRRVVPRAGNDSPAPDDVFISGLDSIKDLAVSSEGFLHVLTERDIRKVKFVQ